MDLPPGATLASDKPHVFERDLPPGATVGPDVDLIKEEQHPRFGYAERMRVSAARLTSPETAMRDLQKIGWEVLPLPEGDDRDEFAIRLPGEKEWYRPENRRFLGGKGILGKVGEFGMDVIESLPEIGEGFAMGAGGAAGAVGGTAAGGPVGGVAGALGGGAAGGALARAGLQGVFGVAGGIEQDPKEALRSTAEAGAAGAVGEGVGRYVLGPAWRGLKHLVRGKPQVLPPAIGDRWRTVPRPGEAPPAAPEIPPQAPAPEAIPEPPPAAPSNRQVGVPGSKVYLPRNEVGIPESMARRAAFARHKLRAQGLPPETPEPDLSRAWTEEAPPYMPGERGPEGPLMGKSKRTKAPRADFGPINQRFEEIRAAKTSDELSALERRYALERKQGKLSPEDFMRTRTAADVQREKLMGQIAPEGMGSTGDPEDELRRFLGREPSSMERSQYMLGGEEPAKPSPLREGTAPELPPAVKASLERSGKLPKEAPKPQEANIIRSKLPIVRLPTKLINKDPDLYQFKQGVNEAGVVKPLEGEWDEGAAGVLQVHKRLDGSYWVGNGHHRLDKAYASQVPDLNAQILDEADGWTVQKVREYCALWNIMDDKGQWSDFAKFFRDSGITIDEAKRRGLLAGLKAKTAWVLAKDAGPDLYGAAIAGKVEPDVAAAIARAAPGDTQLQYFGLKYALDRKLTPHEAEGLVGLRKAKMPAQAQGDVQGDMFSGAGFEAEMAEDLATSRGARGIVTDLQRRRELAHRALRDKAAAAELKIDVSDPNALAAMRKSLDEQLGAWEKWPTSKELTRQARIRAGVEKETPPGIPATSASAAGVTPPPQTSPPGGPLPAPKTKEEAIQVVAQAANQAASAAKQAAEAATAAKKALQVISMSPSSELRAQAPLPDKLPEIPGLSPARQAAIERNRARGIGLPAGEQGPSALPKAVKPEADAEVSKRWPAEDSSSPQELSELQVTREAQAQVKAEAPLPKTGSTKAEGGIPGRQEGTVSSETTPAQAAAIARHKGRTEGPSRQVEPKQAEMFPEEAKVPEIKPEPEPEPERELAIAGGPGGPERPLPPVRKFKPPVAAGGGGGPPRRPPAPPAGGPLPDPVPPDYRAAARSRALAKTREEYTPGHQGGIQEGEVHRQALEIGRQHWGDKPAIRYRVDGPEDIKALLMRGEGEVTEILTIKNPKGLNPATPRIMRATLTPPEDYQFKLPRGARDELKARHNLVTVWEVEPSGEYMLDAKGGYKVRSFHLDEILEAQVRGKVYQFFPDEAAGALEEIPRARIPASRAKLPEPPAELPEPAAPTGKRPGGQLTLEDLLRDEKAGLKAGPPPPSPKPRPIPPKVLLALKERLKLGARGPVLEAPPPRRPIGPEEPAQRFEPRGKLRQQKARWTPEEVEAAQKEGLELPKRVSRYEGAHPRLEKGARALQGLGRLLELPSDLTDKAIDMILSGRSVGYGLRKTPLRGATGAIVKGTGQVMKGATKLMPIIGGPKAAGWSARKLGEALERLAADRTAGPRLRRAVAQALEAVQIHALEPKAALYLILQSKDYEEWAGKRRKTAG